MCSLDSYYGAFQTIILNTAWVVETRTVPYYAMCKRPYYYVNQGYVTLA